MSICIVISGVHHVEQFHNETYPDPESSFSSRNRRSVACEVGARRVRRSCVIIPPAPPKPTERPSGVLKILVADNLGFDGKFFYPNQTPNYNLTMYESSCIFWDVQNETWRGEGCRVSIRSVFVQKSKVSKHLQNCFKISTFFLHWVLWEHKSVKIRHIIKGKYRTCLKE